MPRNLPAEPNAHQPGPVQPAQGPFPVGQTGYADYTLDAEPAGFDWRRYLSAIGRYKWLVIALTAIGTAFGLLVARRIQPLYTATVRMSVQTPTNRAVERGPITTPQQLTGETWSELLTTGTVLEPVVVARRLHIQPARITDRPALADLQLAEEYRPGSYRIEVASGGGTFTLSELDRGVLQQGVVGEQVGPDIGLIWQPGSDILTAGRVIDFDITTVPYAVQLLARNLRPMLSESGSFLEISTTGFDPNRTADLVNHVAESFEIEATEFKKLQLNELTVILAEQLDSASRKLAVASNQLAAFQSSTITAPVQVGATGGPLDTRTEFLQLNMEANQLASAQTVIADAVADGVVDGGDAFALEAVQEVRETSDLMAALNELNQANAELRTLRQQYFDEYGLVIAKQAQIDSLQSITIPRLAETLRIELGRREGARRAQIRSTTQQLAAIPQQTSRQLELEREYDLANNLYLGIKQKYDEAKIAAVSSLPDVRIADRAVVPRRPSADSRPVWFLMSSLGGLGIALLGVLLLDRHDRRVRFPEQVTDGLGLPILGAAPHVRRSNGSLKLQDAAAVVEAFRGIRLNLHYAHGVDGPMAVAVSSPGPGDGKSFVTSNLALAFAEQGYRTVLVDADVRRGTTHRLMDVTRKPGLTDYLAGNASRHEVIQTTRYPYLSVISCGTRMDSGPAMLSSPQMQSLIQDLKSEFSVLLIDTAPLAAGADPLILGTTTGNLVVVLRTGSTDRHLTEAKLGVIDRLPIRLLGAVLNDVPSGRAYSYYYRAYAYLPEYGGEEAPVVPEDDSPAALP